MIRGYENKAFVEIENKSSVTLHGLKPGETTKIEVDAKGTPKQVEWRRRFKDSNVDGAIAVVPSKKSSKREAE